jgi:ABC-type lipoprotein release transport system permease subunit
VLKAILYDVSPLDPISLGAASLMLVLAALAASWIPARRAVALDPLTALRLD